MKPTKPFLCLLILAVSFVSIYSAEAPYNFNFQENQESSFQLRKLYLLSDFAYLVKSLYLCLQKFEIKEIRKFGSDSSTLSFLSIDLNMFILENQQDKQLYISNFYSRMLKILNGKLKECHEKNSRFEWAFLESNLGKLEVIGKEVIKIVKFFDNFSFGKEISSTIEQTVNISTKLFYELLKIIKIESIKQNDQKIKEKELKEYNEREESSNLAAHILIGCCRDGKCNSLDPSKKKYKSSRKKNRGGRKKRTVAEGRNEHSQSDADQSNDRCELLNIKYEDQLVKESVGAVSKLIELLQEIANHEENLVKVSNLFELDVKKLKENFELFKPSKSLFTRFNVLVNEEGNHKHTFEGVKAPSSEYSLRLISKSSHFELNGIVANLETNHCHHSTHKCKEKIKKLINNPD
ncbi:hypothetical protein [Cryptosporidium parvum Iowa II]|uniref:Predicted secreted protein, signal peptide, paralogs n=2 Tax=Cryptosporidium parvum TaxID=5807 RepID=Q5CT44_CRYPI|nr:hypothetical protein [Cryptosporidium parvum Iowa II]EAK88538.1 predicted secreted protein, signal peptide, paralogs [Cryptosporidium parvum Iowa II]QOY43620.1 Signal peptide region containing protein [Cryptosporidium parvum]WKS75907.1 hypothetical protein CPCDC_1g110 [Cryptosporidium sp. 43IA8]WRK30400.1 Signal peptide region containing protein [Cryptosporidium parvum]|eukprot:QOY43620.1 hypothetical protein CPATCC_000426 [Cryptosporidium parvum]